MRFEYIDPLLENLRTNKETARSAYQSNPPNVNAVYEPASPTLLRDWLAISIKFRLQAPWFSKDDVPFHALDNPVHRDRVFGAPFMPASSWKGLLRWAARMKTGLLAHLEVNGNDIANWKDGPELVHLFGNERSEANGFERGALAFRPTWFRFDKIGFEVINPHDRRRKAGTKPILYEVVPPGATGTLNVLYAPAPRVLEADVDRQKALLLLLDAVESLITEYGFSAKRTSGWGVATITSATLRWLGGGREERDGKLSVLRDEAKKLVGGAA